MSNQETHYLAMIRKKNLLELARQINEALTTQIQAKSSVAYREIVWGIVKQFAFEKGLRRETVSEYLAEIVELGLVQTSESYTAQQKVFKEQSQ